MKFSIRDLFLVTMIVALAVGWWAHHRTMTGEYLRLQLENNALRDELQEERFPRIEPANSEAMPSHTLEWIPPTRH